MKTTDLARSACSAIALTVCLYVASTLPAQAKYQIVHNFSGGDGSRPSSELSMDAAGNLYGVTEEGGASNNGAVFKIAPDGTETVLHSFSGGKDGGNPDSGITIDEAHGVLYGATAKGGKFGFGVLFRIGPDGAFKTMHAFNGADGDNPFGRLNIDSLYNLYGVTLRGGNSGYGVVYKLAADGKYRVLHAFTGGDDGSWPLGRLVMDSDGSLYGAAEFGGGDGYGTLYWVTQGGEFYVRHTFTGGSDGGWPVGGLAIGGDPLIKKDYRAVWASTYLGGQFGYGVVLKVQRNGTVTVLHAFAGGDDGAHPNGADMLRTETGGLVATTEDGGGAGCGGGGCGTVYEIGRDGRETILHSFAGAPNDGSNIHSGLLQTGQRTFYGVAQDGGTAGHGVVFRLQQK